ncbi:MAG: 4'-phosphopantetheinyl transferase superfamily protein [Oscillospiraceae bacterium]|nr:4'-phosphopantetheinyl transferase superfamily protein [Oscillospiraceae bacterium]
MMNYYLLDASALPDPKEDEAAMLGIPDWRCAYILRYLRACDRKLSLGAWRIMESALKQHGFLAENVVIGKNGKPECDGVYFNLSHSADMVLCAVSDVPIGCDIEKVTDAPMEVAERYFSEKERRYIANAQNPADADRRFFRLWTMKESYMKMTGEGMSLSPDRLETDPCGLTIMRDGILQSCAIQNSAIDDYEISICMKIL